MKEARDLKELLLSVNHRGYPAYKETRGSWRFDGYTLSIDHVQGDPFASPSRLHVEVPGSVAGFRKEQYTPEHRRIALQDLLLRCFGQELGRREKTYAGSGKSGMIDVSRPGQEILDRSACQVRPADGTVILCFEVGFPANGRTINSPELIRILFDFLPSCVSSSLVCKNISSKAVERVLELADDQKELRAQLEKNNLCAFVADGAVLPRESGVSARPMKGAVPFQSPESMAVTMELPHRGAVRGMGIRKGITLIVGGGYHGKSTLLQALEKGVYNHIAGDGREYVVTDSDAVKIRAEDGRSIKQTDISMFIRNLPDGRDTRMFRTEDASGSTSQAANVVEAIEAGAGTLLIDEDTCATNFMVRDELMQRVISREQEPITPYIERVRELYEKEGISTILVAGSSGSYFYVADTVLQMDRYVPKDITERAKQEAARYALSGQAPAGRKAKAGSCPDSGISGTAGRISGTVQTGQGKKDATCGKIAGEETADSRTRRIPAQDLQMKREGTRLKIKTLGKDAFMLDHETVDLRCVEQIADQEQTAALGAILRYAILHEIDGKKDIVRIADAILEQIRKHGPDAVMENGYPAGGFAMPRREEIFACLNRYRRLRL